MSKGLREVEYIKVDKKKYDKNYDNIFGGKDDVNNDKDTVALCEHGGNGLVPERPTLHGETSYLHE